MKNSTKITIPTYITLVRLLVAPIMVPFFIVHYLPAQDVFINIAIAILFLFFGFTDFLDGFFARKYCQQTKIGATLDHLADKFLTFSALIALLAVGKISYIFVLLLVGRELLIMGLREIALEHGSLIKVASSGKLKTCLHIGTITWIIINPCVQSRICFFNQVQLILLVASVALAWFSAAQYFIIFYRSLKK